MHGCKCELIAKYLDQHSVADAKLNTLMRWGHLQGDSIFYLLMNIYTFLKDNENI